MRRREGEIEPQMLASYDQLNPMPCCSCRQVILGSIPLTLLLHAKLLRQNTVWSTSTFEFSPHTNVRELLTSWHIHVCLTSLICMFCFTAWLTFINREIEACNAVILVIPCLTKLSDKATVCYATYGESAIFSYIHIL